VFSFSSTVIASDQEYEVFVEWQIEVSYFPVQEIDLFDEQVSSIMPNPFNPNREHLCVLYFTAKEQKEYSINIYNVAGQFVKSVNSEFIEQKGEALVYQAQWNGRNENDVICTSGLYLFKISIENKTYIKKMIILY